MRGITYELLDEYHHARCLSVAEIAAELGVSPSTVYRHMRRLKVPLRSQQRVPSGKWRPRPASKRRKRRAP